MIHSDNITYGDSVYGGNQIYWQSVLFEGKEIGALATKQGSILKALNEWHQICVEDTQANKDAADNWYISEDKGFIFIMFYTLDKMISYLNSSQ